jgi:allantoate deiminase
MADLCPIAMMFTRCRDGVSHHPDEHVRPEDMAAAVDTLARFLVEPAPGGA